MKKILIMDTGSLRVFGGAAKTAHDTYLFLKKRGYKVDLYGDFSAIDKEAKAVGTAGLKPDYYDVVMLNSIRDIPVVTGNLNPSKTKTRFIYTDRGNVICNFRNAGAGRLLPKMVARQYLIMKMRGWLDSYVALNLEQEEAARTFFPSNVKIKFIPNWYSDEFKRLKSIKKSDAAIYVGRLDERQKKVSFLVRGMARFLENHQELKDKVILKVVGEGPDEKRYKALASGLGLSNNIRFYGFVDQTELIRLYNRSLFFVSTSVWEGMSGTFIEAMATGLPLLINERNNTHMNYANKELLVTDNYNGLVYEYDNLEDFSDKFSKLYLNEPLRKKLADNSYSFSKNFTMAENLNRYVRIIESLG